MSIRVTKIDNAPKKTKTKKRGLEALFFEAVFHNPACFPAIAGDMYEINIADIDEDLLGRTDKSELIKDPTNLQCRMVAFISSKFRKHGLSSPISVCIRDLSGQNGKIRKALLVKWNYNQLELEKYYPELLHVGVTTENSVKTND